ncbi:MAG: prepilin peptidase [Hamadaea sp.]|uniref:prepilin peptidase n=1 Tax=Hamadaea sp. TaxID=2024425 RepID=UPI00182F0E97|nr:A24 family peptidase [Hamadaea sp.]NUR71220.1 prepilin peptidase [Hamadaea sp.]NUT17751.1 prepilin peptidase [Hamadaea sp.]
MSSTSVALCGFVGGVGGLLTAWPAYRFSVAWGEPPRSTCATCGFSFTTWVRLKHRCAGCGTVSAVNPVWTALAGATSFALLAWALPVSFFLIACLFMALSGVLLSVVDLKVQRLPDPLVLVTFLGTAALLTLHAAVTGTWPQYARGWLGGGALLLAYLVFAVLPGAPMGLGDVKLAGVLGLVLGYAGWSSVFLGAILPFVVNGPFAVVALIRRGRKARSPFGPALLVAWLIVVVFAAHP